MRAVALRRSLAATLAVSLAAAGAAAASGSMQVSVEGCAMPSEEVARLVQLELSSVLTAGADASAYRVTIRCDGTDVHISLFDPITQKNLARTVVAPPPTQPEPERLVALTVAQLYRAAWLELAADDPAPLSSAHPAARPPEEIASARRAAEQALRDAPSDGRAAAASTAAASIATAAANGRTTKPEVSAAGNSPSAERPISRQRYLGSWSLGVALGMRARHLEAPLLLPSMELTATWAPSLRSLRIFAHGGMEWADVTRETGMLETLLVHGGAGMAVEPLTSGPWSGFVEMAAGLTYLTISGHAARAPYVGKRLGGAGFEGSVGLGVGARLDAVRLELIGRGGLLVGTPTGIVDGDDDLSLDGAWAGAELRFNWLL